MQKRTSAKRKLIKYPLLEYLTLKYLDGVPLARLIRQHELDMSSPSLSKLLNIQARVRACKDNSIEQQNLKHSLDPAWLDNSEGAPNVQVNPDGWYYLGRFPKGTWKLDTAEN